MRKLRHYNFIFKQKIEEFIDNASNKLGGLIVQLIMGITKDNLAIRMERVAKVIDIT